MSKNSPTQKTDTEVATPEVEPRRYRKPTYTVREEENGFHLEAEIPGVAKKGVTIAVKAGTLSVTADREPTTPEDWELVRQECSHDSYQLLLKLNAPIDEEKITAKVKDGLLSLHLPVRETAKPRTIKVA